MTAPTFVSAGAIANGTGAINPAPGAHQAGDLLLVPVETGQEAVATPAGYALMPTSPILVSTSGRGTVFHKFAASGAEPGPSIADPGDHVGAVVLAFRGVHPTKPFAAIAAAPYAGTTAVRFPALYEGNLSDDAMLVCILMASADGLTTPQASAEANASLASVAERFDGWHLDGNGGGIVVITGTKAALGEVLETTLTLAASSAYVAFTIALNDAEPAAAFSKSGTVTINGVAAPNGGNVEIWDNVLQVKETTVVIAGGAGGWTANLRYNTANRYYAKYDNGTNRGVSALFTAV